MKVPNALFPVSLFLISACRGDVYQWTTLAGKPGFYNESYVDGPGDTALFSRPERITLAPNGNFYMTDSGTGIVRRMTPEGEVSTPPGALSAGISFYGGITVDTSGNIFVSDRVRHVIKKITPDGQVSIFAGKLNSYGSDNGKGEAARFDTPCGLASGSNGALYLADNSNKTIRTITPGGVVGRLAGLPGFPGTADGSSSIARFSDPTALSVGTGGNIFVTDTSMNTIREITPGGGVSTLAGLAFGVGGPDDGTGASARFNNPSGITVDSLGNIFVADTQNHAIRKIIPGRVVTTIGGLARWEGSKDEIGAYARFSQPADIAVDSQGGLYVTDWGNRCVRKGVLVPEPSALSNWRLEHFDTRSGTGSSADAYDYDQDGLANLVEYAFDLDPKSSDSSGVPSWEHTPEGIRLVFSQPTTVNGITYSAEWSTDLEEGSWHSIPDQGSGGNHHFSTSPSGYAHFFTRIRITSP
ncbi:MAG: hypothetical protein EOP86_11515 [Verrucomicrobiaceae bacterium]|nr:MAG: hypothetical protein EOP86_11515 [Verrucomicrobiaceae bacterium]